MNYSDDIDCIWKEELTNLINMVRQKELAFVPYTVERYYEIYKKYKYNKKAS